MKHLPAYVVALLSLGFALAPALTSPFSGFEAAQLPIPQIDPPIQPAGFAFAIWGVIYVWLIISAGYGLWQRRDADDWNHARVPLMFSLAVGVPWLAIANASAIWASVAIIIMAAGAVLALIRAPARDRLFFQTPVALFAGWLTAASAVSVATTLAGYGVLTGAFGWAIIGIGAALLAACLVFARRPAAPEYLLPVVWALVGIIAANGSAQILVAGFAALGVVVLLALILGADRFLRPGRSHRRDHNQG